MEFSITKLLLSRTWLTESSRPNRLEAVSTPGAVYNTHHSPPRRARCSTRSKLTVHVSVSWQMLRSLPGLAGSGAAASACPRSFSTTQARQHLPSDLRHGVPPPTHPLEASTSVPTILFYNSAYCLRVSLPAVSLLRVKTLDYPLLHL